MCREDEKVLSRFFNMFFKTMLMVKYFKWKTFQDMSHGLKI